MINQISLTPTKNLGLTSEELNRLLDAICIVETNCDPNKVGAAGEIGSYQILRPYWEDAVEWTPEIGGQYSDVTNDDYARKIIRSYWSRYANTGRLGHEATLSDLARIHHGGPLGHKKSGTWQYWMKVRAAMKATIHD